MKKITRFRLDTPEDETSYSVFGLVTSEPDYKLSLSINRKLNINLRKYEPLEIRGYMDEIIHFSRFADLSGHPGELYTLVANRSGKNLFSQKYHRIDYLFLKSGVHGAEGFSNMLSSLRDIEGITAVFQIKETEINIYAFLPQ